MPQQALQYAEEDSKDMVFEAVVIVPGIFTPGGGSAMGERTLITAEVLKKSAASLEGKPVNLMHLRDTEHEVGFTRNVRVGDDGSVRAELVIQAGRPKYEEAVSFIQGRLDAGLVPNVSMEVRNVQEAFTNDEDAEYDVEFLDMEFAGVAILPEGACNDSDGCGIGLSAHEHVLHFQAATLESASTQDPVASITVLAAQPVASDAQPGETLMDEEQPSGACTCGASKDTTTDNAALKDAQELIESLKADLEEAKDQKTTLAEQVEAYEEAESAALAEGIAAKTGVTREEDEATEAYQARVQAAVTDLLGEDPSKAELHAALKALDARPPITGAYSKATGRKTNGTPSKTGGDPRVQHYAAMRAKLGLGEESRLPKGHRNRATEVRA